MLPEIAGKVAWVYDAPNFDADLIIGLDQIAETNINKLKALCMCDFDQQFTDYVKKGDIVVCASNFGYGHPHKGGPDSLIANGVSAFFAESFFPGFYRSHSQRGIPLFECDKIVEEVEKGDRIFFDWDTLQLHLVNKRKSLQCKPITKKNKDLIEMGGIIEYIKQVRLKE